ncbi:MAG: cysteine hydrolase [Chloroflexi bacterium]|nr:cysteine hydrolase [Chloroflexota bacterium]
MALSFAERVQLKNAALVIIDVQHDWCHPDGFFGKRGRLMDRVQTMMPRLLSFIEQAHSVGMPTIYVHTFHSRWTIPDIVPDEAHEPGGSPGAPGSWGAEFHQVQPRPEDYVITKHRYDAFLGTDLELVLRSIGAKTVIITGVATNTCCESTARAAYMRDFYVVFLNDCTATYTEEEHLATLRNIRNRFGVVANADDVVKAWAKLPIE